MLDALTKAVERFGCSKSDVVRVGIMIAAKMGFDQFAEAAANDELRRKMAAMKANRGKKKGGE